MIIYNIIRNQIKWDDSNGWYTEIYLESEPEIDSLYLHAEDAKKDILSRGYVERTWTEDYQELGICPPDDFYDPKYDGPKTAIITGYVKLYPWEPNGFDHDNYLTIEEVEVHETTTHK